MSKEKSALESINKLFFNLENLDSEVLEKWSQHKFVKEQDETRNLVMEIYKYFKALKV